MTILVACYLIVAAVCALATYSEGRRNNGRWSLMRIFGLALSFVWPAVFIAAIAAPVRQNA